MAVLHRALFTWFLLLVFLILLALRLDNRTQWNWFVVFIPMWLYDAMLLTYVAIQAVNDCRAASLRAATSTPGFPTSSSGCCSCTRQRLWGVLQRLWSLTALALKMAFAVLLCLRLNGSAAAASALPSYVVLLPLWLLLAGLHCIVFHSLVGQYRGRYAV